MKTAKIGNTILKFNEDMAVNSAADLMAELGRVTEAPNQQPKIQNIDNSVFFSS